MSNFSDSRKLILISNPLKDSNVINPITLLNISKTDENINVYQTQFYIENNNLKFTLEDTNNKNIEKMGKTESENMNVIDLSLPYSDILHLYNINNYDDLLINIKELLNKENSMLTIERIVNLYICHCYEILKFDNETLIKILNFIFKKKVNNNKIKLFIDEWLKKHTQNDFELNICRDFNLFFN